MFQCFIPDDTIIITPYFYSTKRLQRLHSEMIYKTINITACIYKLFRLFDI